MEKLESHGADQASAGMSSYGEPTSERKPIWTDETRFTASSVEIRDMDTGIRKWDCSGELLPSHKTIDPLLLSPMWSDLFLSQLAMGNMVSIKTEDSREVTNEFEERKSQDSFLSYSEDMITKLMQDSDFEDLLTAGSSSTDAPRSDPAQELPPTNSFDSRPHEIPVIISSMRGGHRCLAPDSSRCAFTKYKFLLANENKQDEAMSALFSFSQPGLRLPLSPLVTKAARKPPQKMATATSEVAHSSSRGKSRISRKRTTLKAASNKSVAKQAAGPSRGPVEESEPFKVNEGMEKPVDDTKAVVCDGCQSTFGNIYNWHRHIQLKRCRERKGRKTDGNIFCSGCGKAFKLLKYLFYHITLKRCKGKNKQE
ncbi:uncharacterized protein [Macrobrachium rosenbergii]|uniref:uncharacterized protein n=1 Tax=Macrobrachium rosenbergii TaxID=79674 RepID=UPI0034D6A427